MCITEKNAWSSFCRGVREADRLGPAGQREILVGWSEASCLRVNVLNFSYWTNLKQSFC